jgi:hypothetical protein
MTEPPPTPKPKGAGCIGGAVLVLGLLILIPSGLCTGTMAILALLGQMSQSRSGAIDVIVMSLMMYGPFVLIGGFLTWLGIRLRRR